MTMGIEEVIADFGLEPHPEGGHFCEVWRSTLELPAAVVGKPDGRPRSAGTSIYFALGEGESSAPHMVTSDELWIHVAGDPLLLETAESADADWAPLTLSLASGQLQSTVPARSWQRARPMPGPCGWSLCVCVVVPGFDFADFTM
jgi:hypothetical protein